MESQTNSSRFIPIEDAVERVTWRPKSRRCARAGGRLRRLHLLRGRRSFVSATDHTLSSSNGKGSLAAGHLPTVWDSGPPNRLLCCPSRTDDIDPRFLVLCLAWLTNRFGSSGSRSALRRRQLSGHQCALMRASSRIGYTPLPPLDTQRWIVRFLDEKTARIGGLIEKKRELLDRLAEKRHALITRAVTKGLNAQAPMKPSGIDWLGNIPCSIGRLFLSSGAVRSRGVKSIQRNPNMPR